MESCLGEIHGRGRVAILCVFLRQRHYGVRERSIRCSVSHGVYRGARPAVAHLKIRSHDLLTSQPRLVQNICDILAKKNYKYPQKTHNSILNWRHA